MNRRRPPFGSQPKITDRLHYEAELLDGDKPMGTAYRKRPEQLRRTGIMER